jgi:hypothetical protein
MPLEVHGKMFEKLQIELFEYWDPLVRKWFTWPNTVFDDGESYFDWCRKLGMRCRLVCERRKGQIHSGGAKSGL